LPITIQTYGVLLVAVVTLWPFLFSGSWSPVSLATSIVVSVVILVVVWRYCSSVYMSFWEGIHVISARLSSGCFNVTILYLLPFLVIVYLISIFFTLEGLFSGRTRSQERWANLIMKFIKKSPGDNSEEP